MMKSMKLMAVGMAAALLIAACGSGESADESGDDAAGEGEDSVTLTIESWRSDDQAIWDDEIIPAFEEEHPNIQLVFQPTEPTEYNGALQSRLEGGEAGDIVACRSYDVSLALFEDGHLAPVDDIEGMDAFDEAARRGWTNDAGDTTYCVPAVSVIHGFYYNQEIFDELGLEVPETVAEFHDVLEAIAADGTYTPIAQGTKDLWDIAEVDYTGIGPNYWQGEEGRQALIAGEARFTDPEYVAPFQEMATWGQFMPRGYEGIGYDDAKVLFTSGEGAIFPGGSWEIAGFEADANFEMGVFKPPLPNEGDQCYISDHIDMGFGMNADTDHPEEVRTFLEWVASPAYAELQSNAQPGFFSLQDVDVEIENELASEFVSWRDECERTIRLPHERLNRGEPALWDELYEVSAAVVNGSVSPADGAKRLQDGLDSWYEPPA